MGLRALYLLGLSACSSSYLTDADLRRQTLVSSLVNADNGYARLRLDHYERDWSQLPESNLTNLDVHASDLGERAFFGYPVQDLSDTHGFENLVTVRYPSGLTGTSTTCASCHVREGIVGAPSVVDRGWGPGLLDVTTSDGSEPVAISDLRPVKFLSHLHHDANVKHTDLNALAIRIETLIITSHAQVSRPPREVSLALAQYVWSLSAALPEPPAQVPEPFTRACAGCHDPSNGFTGPPVSADVVGTDERLAASAERGTGMYRVPSLRGVSTRGALLHDLSVPSLESLLDPDRTTGGHTFGHGLDASSRAALLTYLRAL